jgi:predicted metal-binding membrane protein
VEAGTDEPLAELRLDRHRDLRGRRWEHRGRQIVTGVLVVFVLLAAANVFGQRPSSAEASGAAARLVVSTPAAVRGGLIFQTRIDIEARRSIAHPTLVLGGGWFDSMTLNSVQPGPAAQAARGDGVTLSYPALGAGGRMTVWLEWSANPTNLAWGRPETVALADGDSPLVSLTRHMTVFP